MNSMKCTFVLVFGIFVLGCGSGDGSSTGLPAPPKEVAASASARRAAFLSPAEIIARTVGTAWDQSPEALAKTAQPLVAPVGKLKGPIDEYEEVPGGRLLHQSCIHALPNGARVADDGDVFAATGEKIEHVAPCQYEPILKAAEAAAPAAGAQHVASRGNGNIEWIGGVPASSSWFDGVVSEVTVPSTPTNLNESLFFWSGLDNFSVNNQVLQPILSFGFSPQTCSSGGDQWEIEDYYVDDNGNAYCWEQQMVHPGDTITEYTLALSCPDNTGANCSWLIAYAYNSTTYYAVPPSVQGVLNQAVFQSLEGYDLGTCSSGFPANSGLGFLSGWYQPVPSWNSYNQDTQIYVNSGGPTVASGTGDPNCAYGLAASGIADALLGELEY